MDDLLWLSEAQMRRIPLLKSRLLCRSLPSTCIALARREPIWFMGFA